jgi:hypothetical protein
VATGKRTRRLIRPGDIVAARHGLSDLVGVVREVYGPAGSRHAIVRVPIPGPMGETLAEEDMNFMIAELHLVEAA